MTEAEKRLLYSAAAAALVVVGAAPPARAFAVAHVSADSEVELRWAEDAVIPWTLEHGGVPGLMDPVARDAVAAAFDAWDAVDGAAVTFDEVFEYTPAESTIDEINTLWWSTEDWGEDADVIALTAVSYYEDGQIVDADIDFNGQYFAWSVEPEDEIDLQSVATHEIGHLLGLDHSEVAAATMTAEYVAGDTRPRSLESDDVEGISYLYPCPGSDCGLKQEAGCTIASGRPRSFPGGALLAALGLRAVRRRRTSRAARGEGAGAAWPRSRVGVGLLAALVVSMAVPRMAAGTTVRRMDLAEVADAADVVVRARVDQVIAYSDGGGGVRSRVVLKVRRWIRGDSEPSLVLDRPGGTLDGLTTRVAGAPIFIAGQEVLLFLRTTPRGDLAPVGLWQGRFLVSADGRLASRPEDSAGALPVKVDELVSLVGPP